jgi:hypothetical protein
MGRAECLAALERLALVGTLDIECEQFTTGEGFAPAPCEGDSELTKVDVVCPEGDCSDGLTVELGNATGVGIQASGGFSFANLGFGSGDEQVVCWRHSTGESGCSLRDNTELPSGYVQSAPDGMTWFIAGPALTLDEDGKPYLCSGTGADVFGPIDRITIDLSFVQEKDSYDSLNVHAEYHIPTDPESTGSYGTLRQMLEELPGFDVGVRICL